MSQLILPEMTVWVPNYVKWLIHDFLSGLETCELEQLNLDRTLLERFVPEVKKYVCEFILKNLVRELNVEIYVSIGWEIIYREATSAINEFKNDSNRQEIVTEKIRQSIRMSRERFERDGPYHSRTPIVEFTFDFADEN